MLYIMQPQFNRKKLKLAVIAALSLLALGLPHQALAVGLGDIDVKSHLGQPLRAKIKVLGASSISDPSCFKIGSDSGNPNQLTNARLKLGNITNDTAILSVSTGDVINEPIVNLSVVADCGTSLRRDYVLLMDPPFAEAESQSNNLSDNANNSRTQASEDAVDNIDASSTANVNISEPAAPPQTVRSPARASKKATAKRQGARKKSRPSINLNTVNDANFGAVTGADSEARPSASANIAPDTPPKNVASIVRMPRLSISTGASAKSANMIGLRLDNQLHFDPAAAPIEQAGDIAVQDEVTVMNNRMAYLDQKIKELQQSNDKLKNENKVKDLKIAQNQEQLPGNKLQWLAYLTYGVLLLGGYFAADWWRRRRQNLQLESSETVWENLHQKELSTNAFDSVDAVFGGKTVQVADTNDEKSTATTEYAGGFVPTQAMEAPFFMEEDNSESNILDHADVFLSHGRTSLAIQLLQNHLLDFPKQSVTIWLFLLDLLAKVNLQAVYEQTAMECREHFNVKIPEYGASPDAAYSETSANQSLESYPRLTTGLQQVWGTPAAITFMDDLIYNSRLEVRVGFDKNLIEELVLLKSIVMEELKNGMVVQLEDKKPTLNELKEAQIAAKKADKLLKMDEIPDEQPMPHLMDEQAVPPKQAEAVKREALPALEFTSAEPIAEAPAAETLVDVKLGKASKKSAESFEFNLVDFNQKH